MKENVGAQRCCAHPSEKMVLGTTMSKSFLPQLTAQPEAQMT